MHPPLGGLALVDLLEVDPRPSFVLDLASSPDTPQESTSVTYCNPAFSTHPSLLDVIHSPRERHADFWEWVKGTTVASAATSNGGGGIARPRSSTSFNYQNVYWTRAALHSRWVVIAANEQPPPERPRKVRLDSQEGRFGVGGSSITVTPTLSPTPTPSLPLHDARRFHSTPDPVAGESVAQAIKRSTTDPGWVLPNLMPEQEPFLNVINSTNWATTPLGPMQRWPNQLQQMFNQILADSRPIAIYWGKQYTTVYNEAFSRLCGSKHPGLLGRPVDEAWPDAGDKLKDAMRMIEQKQRASFEDEWRFFVETEDGPEETYLKWSLIPIIESNRTLGFMHPVLETTSMRLWERRMKMLVDLGEAQLTARDVKSYWGKTIELFANVEPRYDIPLVVLYSVDDDPDAVSSGGVYDYPKLCRLEGTLGVPEDHPIAPPTLSLRNSDDALSPMFRAAFQLSHPLLLQTKDGSLPEPLLEGLQWRGFGDPCREAVICAIRPTKEENVMGLMFLGLNPRRPYDNDYRQYISLLAQKLTSCLASTVLLEEEARRGRNAAQQAEFDQAMLKEKLALQTKEATESIQKFEAVAEFIPVGMSFGDAQGNITFANDAWYRITGCTHHGAGPVARNGFLACVLEEDQPGVVQAYDQLHSVKTVTFEFRVKRQNDSPPPPARDSPSFEKAGLDLVGVHHNTLERHVLASVKAERAPDGSILRVLTCLTDVTLHKQAAEEAVRRAQQAENLKRMAEFATVGMYDMDVECRLIGANRVFFEMCGLDRVDPSTITVKPWEKCVVKEDIDIIQESLSRVVHEGKPQTAELRFTTPFVSKDSEGNPIIAPRWVYATFMPVKNSEGVIQSFTGCLSDVSMQKWQIERERKWKEEALESKRQQENFIDMTSHEMRNPLSAIVHCSDAVIASLAKVQDLMPKATADEANRSEEKRLIEASIENSETIVACAQHQKRIVDDILTMSKLDSKLLAVTPITVNPVLIVQEALKMFEVEARRVDIDLSMKVDKTYTDLGVEFLDLDPSRLKQVLINLLTNALKFTKQGNLRNVSITISASMERPTDASSSVQFIPRSEGEEFQQPIHSGREDPIFLMFEVKDTGQGLSEDEKKSLFQRFKQASSRTHIKYGGSGLGLFISRRLTEMQNGAIGVASQPGVGSTFAFYIQTHRPTEAALHEAQAAAQAAWTALHPAAIHTPGNALGRAGRRFSIGSINGHAITPMQGEAEVEAPPINGVLVVEDNLINQQITRRGLVDRGFTVDVANHGIEALDKLSASNRMEGGSTPLSVILMDVEMPIQDGLTCTRNIRELERQGKIKGGRIPIIAVSANARMEQILEAKAAGCDDVLVKPYRMPELIEKMKVVMLTVAQTEQEEEDVVMNTPTKSVP